MAYCGSCGWELLDDDAFCSGCGAVVGRNVPVDVAVDEPCPPDDAVESDAALTERRQPTVAHHEPQPVVPEEQPLPDEDRHARLRQLVQLGSLTADEFEALTGEPLEREDPRSPVDPPDAVVPAPEPEAMPGGGRDGMVDPATTVAATTASPTDERSAGHTSCPYCFGRLTDSQRHTCEECGAVLHDECWEENGGCTTFGCARWIAQQSDAVAPVVVAAAAVVADPPTARSQSQPNQVNATSPAQEPGVGVAGWHRDPRRRHQYRYWNGKEWTAHVSDQGQVAVDPHGSRPTPLPDPPGGSVAPKEWYPDPSGRHQFRFWNGRVWTRHVANAGLQSEDPPTLLGD
jgi:Protein of unknown function (DUF2510)